MTPGLLAVGMGGTTYTPALKNGDPEVKALSTLFAYQDGVQVLPETIEYLNERAQFEVSFLENLSRQHRAGNHPVGRSRYGFAGSGCGVCVGALCGAASGRRGRSGLCPAGIIMFSTISRWRLRRSCGRGIAGKKTAAPLNLSGDVCAPCAGGVQAVAPGSSLRCLLLRDTLLRIT